MTYELSQNQSTEVKDSRKKRTLALKVADEYEDDTESSYSQKEDELALTTREFKKFLKRRKKLRRRKPFNKVGPSKEKDQQITCFGCKKSGHYRHECPQLRKATKNI